MPAGSHNHGKRPDAHIFVDYKAPWQTIDDDLEQHGTAPHGGMEDIANTCIIRCQRRCCARQLFVWRSSIRSNVTFQGSTQLPLYPVQASPGSSIHNQRFLQEFDEITFVRGQERVKTYKVPSARFFSHAFCDQCGSGMPRLDEQRKIAVIPMGVLDDDPGVKPVDHIFVGDKADWYDPPEGLATF